MKFSVYTGRVMNPELTFGKTKPMMASTSY
jgi:hypothetical protein